MVFTSSHDVAPGRTIGSAVTLGPDESGGMYSVAKLVRAPATPLLPDAPSAWRLPAKPSRPHGCARPARLPRAAPPLGARIAAARPVTATPPRLLRSTRTRRSSLAPRGRCPSPSRSPSSAGPSSTSSAVGASETALAAGSSSRQRQPQDERRWEAVPRGEAALSSGGCLPALWCGCSRLSCVAGGACRPVGRRRPRFRIQVCKRLVSYLC